MTIEIKGQLERITYHNEESAYTIVGIIAGTDLIIDFYQSTRLFTFISLLPVVTYGFDLT
jgi:hypothetical protein